MKTFMLLDVTTGGQVAEETGEAIQQVDVSILELILEGSSGIGGGAVMILLALMSVTAIYRFFERTMAIAKAMAMALGFRPLAGPQAKPGLRPRHKPDCQKAKANGH